MIVCQALMSDCDNEATHNETLSFGLMQREYSCCEEHCKCDWHDDDTDSGQS